MCCCLKIKQNMNEVSGVWNTASPGPEIFLPLPVQHAVLARLTHNYSSSVRKGAGNHFTPLKFIIIPATKSNTITVSPIYSGGTKHTGNNSVKKRENMPDHAGLMEHHQADKSSLWQSNSWNGFSKFMQPCSSEHIKYASIARLPGL